MRFRSLKSYVLPVLFHASRRARAFTCSRRAQPPSTSFSRCRQARPSRSCRLLFALHLLCSPRVHRTCMHSHIGAAKSWDPFNIEGLSECRGNVPRLQMFRFFLPRRDFPMAQELCLALLDVIIHRIANVPQLFSTSLSQTRSLSPSLAHWLSA